MPATCPVPAGLVSPRPSRRRTPHGNHLRSPLTDTRTRGRWPAPCAGTIGPTEASAAEAAAVSHSRKRCLRRAGSETSRGCGSTSCASTCRTASAQDGSFSWLAAIAGQASVRCIDGIDECESRTGRETAPTGCPCGPTRSASAAACSSTATARHSGPGGRAPVSD